MDKGTSGEYTIVLTSQSSTATNTEGYELQPVACASHPPSQATSLSTPPPAISNPVETNSPEQQQEAGIVVISVAGSNAALVDEPERPPDYLALSLFNLLCWCFPIGVIAFLYSLEVKTELEAGRYEEARKASKYAKQINYCGLRVGSYFAFFFALLALIVIGGAIAVAVRD